MPVNHDFTSKNDPQTLLVYGMVTDPAAVARSLEPMPPDSMEPDGPFMLSNRFAVISPSSPGLRLNSPGWIELSPIQMMEVASTLEIFDLCRERVMGNASPFSRSLRTFLEAYFQFVAAQTENHQSDLEPAEAEADVFNHTDWVFSAWLPLPHAHVLLPDAGASDTPLFAELDVAFLLGDRLLGVMIDGINTPTKSQRQRRHDLEERHPNATIVHVPATDLEDKAGAFPADLFPTPFLQFWKGLDLPLGPYRPSALMDDLGESG